MSYDGIATQDVHLQYEKNSGKKKDLGIPA